ncbi:MAG: type III-B CRISPR module RAMP protein Cmr6 [Lunatimonas sp.]|uniref:type III-B CRISPR module RAMP protein Cmr6 n=1 Tax=Lunatimonas sp. TaxID=2060141 RepID=UPI00263B61C3|nr:type III-B CRISPR module RAMP protein Cmr6 [Lunatimonas sp.]MCC5937997.1 type III-B CRISPR module RAMP protein Cmr6 [Lunatimonas sp.]
MTRIEKFSPDANSGWCFYRGMYAALDKVKNLEHAEKENYQTLSESIVSQPLKHLREDVFFAAHSFELSLTYPGLLIGSGYQHESGAEGESKIGFYFDYTTGLPEVPGSSVKGMLRSNFPGNKEGELEAAKIEWISTLINEILEKQGKSVNIEGDQLRRLEMEIFEGVDYSKPDGNFLSSYRRDCFYGALLSPANRRSYPFLGTDYVTPHPDWFKDPVPLMFLKVMPGIILLFNFRLFDSMVIPEVTKEVKLELFKQLLMARGIGAKTNVGYGQLNPVQYLDELHGNGAGFIEKDKAYPGEIVGVHIGYLKVRFSNDSGKKSALVYRKSLKVGDKKIQQFSAELVGKPVTVKIQKDYIAFENIICTLTLSES